MKYHQRHSNHIHPVYIGTREVSKTLLESKDIKKVLNLCYDANKIPKTHDTIKEIDLTFIKDINEFYKQVVIKQSTLKDHMMQSFLTHDTSKIWKCYCCDKCFRLWASKKKKRFEEHNECKHNKI